MAFFKLQLDTESAAIVAEAVKNAEFTPWQLIVLILGGILLWNLPGLYRIHMTKYQTRRKYDLLDKKADHKVKIMNAKKQAKAEKQIPPRKS